MTLLEHEIAADQWLEVQRHHRRNPLYFYELEGNGASEIRYYFLADVPVGGWVGTGCTIAVWSEGKNSGPSSGSGSGGRDLQRNRHNTPVDEDRSM